MHRAAVQLNSFAERKKHFYTALALCNSSSVQNMHIYKKNFCHNICMIMRVTIHTRYTKTIFNSDAR